MSRSAVHTTCCLLGHELRVSLPGHPGGGRRSLRSGRSGRGGSVAGQSFWGQALVRDIQTDLYGGLFVPVSDPYPIVACTVMSTDASARETGHAAPARSATSCNAAASSPSTLPVTCSADAVIVGAPEVSSNVTSAVTSR